MYDKLAGMTGTAATEEEELRRIYDLEVTVLPTNVEYRARFGDLEEREVVPAETGVAFAGAINGHEQIRVTIFDGPTGNRFYRRLDMPDQIYKTERAKFDAVIEEIRQSHEAGRPVLVGTAAIETSERLSAGLKRRRIPHNVLNAKYHEREAVIIAQGGRPGAVTLATNMAGRGVDILLGGNPEGLARDQMRREEIELTAIPSQDWEQALRLARQGTDPVEHFPERWAEILRDKVRECQLNRERVYELGGLHVIGTERHEARRIDNQLRGRAGRQGEPGSSRFYVSLEDDLMRRFGGDRLQPWMERAGMDDAPLEFSVLTKMISSIQERVEGYNFDIRKHVLEYDNVVNKQREVVYAERQKILSRKDLREDLLEMTEEELRKVVLTHTAAEDPADWDLSTMLAELRRFAPVPRQLTPEELIHHEPQEIVARLLQAVEQTYNAMYAQLGEQAYQVLRQEELSLHRLEESDHPFHALVVRQCRAALGEQYDGWADSPIRRLSAEAETALREIVTEAYRRYRDRQLMLRTLDDHWVRHLTDLDVLREGIGLRAIGQQKPLVAYQKEAFDMYQEMLDSVQSAIVRSLFLVPQSQTARSTRRRPNLTLRRPQLQALRAGSQPAQEPTPHTSRELPGRNDPCWCGSGKKYKHCHWRSDQRAAAG